MLKAVLIGFKGATLAVGFLATAALGAADAFFAAMVFFAIAIGLSTFD
ncbi:hypothetical protein [Hydrogenophaga sp. Root209]|nr:hypothetical protein [Hydrogenophaga sp. Root209]